MMEQVVAKRVGALVALIAFAAVAIVGALNEMTVRQTITRALVAMFVFYVLGCMGGWIAFRVISEGIRDAQKAAAQLANSQEGTGEQASDEREGG